MNQQQAERRFAFTENVLYRLTFANAYSAIVQAEGSYEAMRDRAAEILWKSRKRHAITSLTKGWEWEIEDDGNGMVDPRSGVLEIDRYEAISHSGGASNALEDIYELLDDGTQESFGE